ncbi:Uncharacterised protein [Mycoplasmopsis bovigenitalium]|uniref:ECF transporter S component n=1 Tax=Mycoplasmopsis bovigenitalium TaxID=2112 RepID=A0A449A8S9_9BACT|nr:hypothetical protein [Mycoplasmopsis bovigenitalium]VEU60693.1 Uncharacterised protein [Mycoplasmopsis bovigenitalium]
MNNTSINTKKNDFKKIFKLTPFELVLASALLAMHLVIMIIAKFTILRAIPVPLEYILYIFYGLILGGFKGAVLAVIADTFVMLMTGSIGSWYWLYAITPPLIALTSWLYYLMFKYSKYTRFIISYVSIIAAFALCLWVYIVRSDENGALAINKTIKASKLVVLTTLTAFGLLTLGFTFAFTILYAKTKNEKWNNYLMVTSIIIVVAVLFRWILGTISWIEYYNYINKAQNGKFKSYGVDFIITFLRIVVKDIFILPIYIVILAPIYSAIAILKQKYLIDQQKVRFSL